MANLKVEQALRRANAHESSGQLNAARQIYREILTAFPANVQAKLALARLGPQEPQGAGGNAALGSAVQKLAMLYKNGQMAAVVQEGHRITKAHPGAFPVWNLIGAAEQAQGHLELAAAAFSRAVELNPKAADAHNNLGYALEQQGRLKEAVESYKRALGIQPSYAVGHNNLGNALKSLGDIEEATAHYKQAVKLQPKYAEALYNLGNAFAEQKKLDDALGCYAAALSVKPDFAEACHNLGNALFEKGELTKAGTAFIRALKIRPDYVDALRGLGRVLKEDRKFGPAIENLERALELDPDDVNSLMDLGDTLREIRRHQDAQASYRKALDLNPNLPEAWVALGATSLLLGDAEDAVACCMRALEIKPDSAQAHLNLGNAYKDQGKMADATESYLRAIEIQPKFSAAHRNLGTITKYKPGDAHIQALLALHADSEVGPDDRTNVCFALAKAFEDIDEPEQSLTYLKEGNALWKKKLDYNIQSDHELFEKLRKSARPILSATLDIEPDPDGIVPVFVVGMPRSGTTLAEQIISIHPEVTGAGELEFVNMHGQALAMGEKDPTPENLLEFRNKYLADLGRLAQGRRYVTDKMPHNFRYAPLIAAALPEARIIRLKRDPAAICWSNFKHFFGHKGLGYCYDLGDVVEFHGLFSDLMVLWSELLGDRFYELDYERLTVEQEEETRKLIDFVGLPWNDACLSPQKNERSVRTASQLQVREKVYTGSSQQWRKFEPFLDGAFDALA